MTPRRLSALSMPLLFALAAAAQAQTPTDPEKLYESQCLSCHAPNRLGGMGPALLPETLVRLKPADAEKIVVEGLPATQMPAFGQLLSPEQIAALVSWIYTPSKLPPTWGAAEIAASRIVYSANVGLPAKPVFAADPLNLTLVVEHGDHHITVLDGDAMEPLLRFATRPALHGGLKFSRDGRFVYWATRGGWITKFDLWNLKVVAEVRAGINTRNLAASSDGRYLMVANYLPHTLVALDARDLSLVEVIPVVAANGKSSRVSAVYDARPRGSFIAALKDIPEVWEIAYDGKRARNVPGPGPLPVRKIKLDAVLDDFFFDQGYTRILGASRDRPKGQVVDIDAGRKIADLDLAGMPHLGSGTTWDWQGRRVMASANLQDGLITIIDMGTWKTVKTLRTQGPGFFMRSHENTPYVFADVFSGPHKDLMHVIDKRSLEIVADLRPEPGKTSTHTEFDRHGKYALVSIWDRNGALVVYDAATLREVKRLPMNLPVGKYNVWNKTRLSEGTSH